MTTPWIPDEALDTIADVLIEASERLACDEEPDEAEGGAT